MPAPDLAVPAGDPSVLREVIETLSAVCHAHGAELTRGRRLAGRLATAYEGPAAVELLGALRVSTNDSERLQTVIRHLAGYAGELTEVLNTVRGLRLRSDEVAAVLEMGGPDGRRVAEARWATLGAEYETRLLHFAVYGTRVAHQLDTVARIGRHRVEVPGVAAVPQLIVSPAKVSEVAVELLALARAASRTATTARTAIARAGSAAGSGIVGQAVIRAGAGSCTALETTAERLFPLAYRLGQSVGLYTELRDGLGHAAG